MFTYLIKLFEISSLKSGEILKPYGASHISLFTVEVTCQGQSLDIYANQFRTYMYLCSTIIAHFGTLRSFRLSTLVNHRFS